jgi:tRNA-Thr(GGU) m(6)t(6)A37 methyltransferase TsaA
MKDALFSIVPIGTIGKDSSVPSIVVAERFRPTLLELDGFSHLIVLWWSDCYPDGSELMKMGECLSAPTDYSNGWAMGIFATRSPVRPNPICLSVVRINSIDPEKRTIRVGGIDAFPGSPVLDAKPYYSCLDRAR